jgi:hypothetical protein
MALTLLIAGAYAGYIAQQRAEMAKYDESIHLEGKTKVQLLMGERMDILEIPLTCLNWFEGDYRKVVPHLRQRMDEILKKNPFLGGWLILDKDDNVALTLFYDQTGQDLNNKDKIFQVYEPNHENDQGAGEDISEDAPLMSGESEHKPKLAGKLALTPRTSYKDMSQQLRQAGAMLPLQHELVGKDSPLLRVSIIPDAQQPTERFALVVTMAHALGDSHTLYKIVHMLDVAKGYAQKLIVERDHAAPNRARDKMGKDAFEFLTTALKNPPIDMTEKRNEPTVMKVFHIKESWFTKKDRRARRGSVFAEVATDYQEQDSGSSSISQNSILASWFFNLAASDIAFVGLNLRDRLDGCLVSDFHAGNYVAGIPYTPADYATPELVERSVATLKRSSCEQELPPFRWNNSASIALNWAHRFQTKLQLLPHGEGACDHLSHIVLFDAEILQKVPGRLSLCYMFTSALADPGVSNKGEGVEITLDDSPSSMEEIAAKVADQLEGGDADEAGDGAEEDALMNGRGKRAGLLVVCRQSVWDEIEKSGIVDEMIDDSSRPASNNSAGMVPLRD